MNEVHSTSKIQKFYYIKSVLKGGEVQVIPSLDISASNYDVAWDCLRKRHDNKRLITQNHMKNNQIPKEKFTVMLQSI